MNALEIIIGALILLVSVAVIFAVIMQQGHRAGITGAIAGGADTFLSKNKARTADAFLRRITKWLALAFIVLAVVANIIALN